MLNTNRVRGIMRARNGSQIPKFKLPAGPIINNDALVGSTEAKPFKPLPTTKDLINVTTPQNLTKLSLPKSIQDRYNMEKEALDKIANEEARIKAAKGLANGTHMLSNGEVVYDFKGQVVDPLMDKAGDLLSNVGNISKKYPDIVGAGIDLIGSQFNDVENSSGVDTAFNAADMVTNGLMSVNPAVGLIGKAALTAFKGINSLGGKYSDSFSVNQDTIAQVGSSYGGSVADINNAASKAGKKYGLFSSGARRDANRQIAEAKRQQNIMTDIADEASMQKAMSGNDLNYLNYNFNLSGGYDQRYMRAARLGMKLQDKIDFIKQRKINTGIINLDTKEIDWEPEVIVFKTGGVIESDYDIIYEIPKVEEFQKGGKTRTLEELIEYAKKENPRFIQRLSENPRGVNFVDEEGKNAQGSHLLGYELDEEGNAIVFPSIQEMEDGNLKYLSVWDAFDRAIEKKNFLKMTPEEAKLFTESGEDEQGNLFGYKKGWPEFFKKFKKGGTLGEELETPEIEETNQKNLIPKGALHKNKHHMEHTEGLTQKGIPVIDNEGEQQAEIELDEIIFTLEVTKKLEELYKDGSDEAAIEAGKLLVKEILFNTDDRTGLISKCEEGGKICQIEE